MLGGRLIGGPTCSGRTRGGSRLGCAEPAAHVLPASHGGPRPGLRDPPANEPRRDVEGVHAVLKHPDPCGGPRRRPPAGRPVRGCPAGPHGRVAPPPAGAPQRGVRGPRVNGHYARRVPPTQALLPINVRHVPTTSLLRFSLPVKDIGLICDQSCVQWRCRTRLHDNPPGRLGKHPVLSTSWVTLDSWRYRRFALRLCGKRGVLCAPCLTSLAPARREMSPSRNRSAEATHYRVGRVEFLFPITCPGYSEPSNWRALWRDKDAR